MKLIYKGPGEGYDTMGVDARPGVPFDVSHLEKWQVEWLKRHGCVDADELVMEVAGAEDSPDTENTPSDPMDFGE